ncbi:uncharacterized protein LOC143205273 [Rhynchophorus ferrugineus]|uniref:Secreted protein n=1 Tax=Rhynchophorus ferrugineus TaxID=354439 RepID=A0A834J0I6_RHYFE|nr:hypothetical protein GWI33_000275 [Rhynchophorus ferrugineus]
MGLVMVNAMDKIVLFLIITAVATQALQIAGIVDTPISSVDIKLNEPVSGNQIIQQNINDLNKEMEATTERSQFIDALFNVSIDFLTNMGDMFRGRLHHNWLPMKLPKPYLC